MFVAVEELLFINDFFFSQKLLMCEFFVLALVVLNHHVLLYVRTRVLITVKNFMAYANDLCFNQFLWCTIISICMQILFVLAHSRLCGILGVTSFDRCGLQFHGIHVE